MTKLYWYCGSILARSLLKTFARFQVEGLEYIREMDGPAILIANHASYLDPAAIAAAMPLGSRHVPVRFLARKEIYLPVLSWGITAMGAVRLDTKNPLKALRIALDMIKDGASIGIFPEGTRSLDGRLKDFLKGADFLALKADVPVVPIVIHGTFKSGEGYVSGIKKTLLFIARRYSIKVIFGTPVHGDIEGSYRAFYNSVLRLDQANKGCRIDGERYY